MIPVFDRGMRYRFEVPDGYHSTVYLPSEDPSPFAPPQTTSRRQVVFWRGYRLVSCKLYTPATGMWVNLSAIQEILDRYARVVPITQEQLEAAGGSEKKAYREMAVKAHLMLPPGLNTMIDIEDGVNTDDNPDV